MKAVAITNDNYRKLAAQYDVSEVEMKGAVGFWLVAPFGRDARPEGYLTKVQLLEKFDLGGKIKNGWYELTEKAPQ